MNGCRVSAKIHALRDGFRAALAAAAGAQGRDFLGDFGWDMPIRSLSPRPLPCLGCLSRVNRSAPAWARPLTDLLETSASEFHWGQTYVEADFGRHFLDNYGWLEVFGTRGHFAHDRVAGGLLVLGPEVVYPDHHHVAEELYVPLTGGAEWRMGNAAFAPREAGEVILHASNVSHAMRTGAESLLALYLWRGGPLAARSVITGTVAEASR